MESNFFEKAQELRRELAGKSDVSLNMLVGVDGFVDEIVHAVDKRIDFNNFSRVEKIEDFGKRILKAAGLSANIEFIPVQTKLGGNGPIFSNALLRYGVKLSYVGTLGNPDIHPVFKEMAEKCENIYSLAEPGHTDALEFTDGKLMLGKHTSLKEADWERFKDVVGGLDKVVGLIKESDLFGMENWTMMPNMSQIWEGIIEEVFPLLPDRVEKPLAFFDLADPEKRTKEDILHAMKLIGEFERKFRAILGLNEKELYEIAEVFGIAVDEAAPADERLKAASEAVFDKLGIYCLVVHPTKEAICFVGGKYYRAAGPYCQKPVLTTGAGDNFNAGFCFGCALGLDPQSALMLGVATSGYYVRNAKSPTFDAVLQFLDDWVCERI